MEAFAESDRPKKRPKHQHTESASDGHFAATGYHYPGGGLHASPLPRPLSPRGGVDDAVADSINTTAATLTPMDDVTTWSTDAPTYSSWQWSEINQTPLSLQPSAVTLSFSSDDSMPDMRIPSATALGSLPLNYGNLPELASPTPPGQQQSPVLIKPQPPPRSPYEQQPSRHHQENEVDRHQYSMIAPALSTPSPRLTPDTRLMLRQQSLFVSPFKDFVQSFGKAKVPLFPRPNDGQVNGYVKFSWSRNRLQPPGPQVQPSGRVLGELSDDHIDMADMVSREALEWPNPHQNPPFGPMPPEAIELSGGISPASSIASPFFPNHPMVSALEMSPSQMMLPSQALANNKPQLNPPGFGLEASMDDTDRKLFDFYIKNWCPGRSVLQKTNLWRQDFAQMQKSPGILAAMQSLAGIYIYDYQPVPAIQKRVVQKFGEAEARLKELLKDHSDIVVGKGSEVITILVILSMHDIVLTERRLKKPHIPRWLHGFRQSEYFLDVTDTGSRFWNTVNIQQDSLVVSQSIIVGRAVILAQPMMPLTEPASFDPESEAQRFGWLLYGSPMELYEIHGGCGFSKKLMHVMSQITYCAARLQQDPESAIIPTTATYILRELQQMRQWSSESMDWETAKTHPQTIERVESWRSGFVVSTSSDMTDVTAEAWRFAAIIYLQCRLLRLPRNDPAVIESLEHLANCIRVMPTSGGIFTAQAPLFPVFLLGLLSTRDEHEQASQRWFNHVVRTPVRSSVPPLYNVLQRIWRWIGKEMEPPPPGSTPSKISDREPWWELLVSKVEERENETLCLT